jgi:uncharacterized phiE125 gp8 family phage protein
MALVLHIGNASGGSVEPISVAELKIHLRLDSNDDDTALASLITTARLQIETALSLALINQNWTWTFDGWPRRASIELPISPVQSITDFTVAQREGPLTVPPSAYILDGQGIAARLITKTGWPQPAVAALGIEIKFVAGFGPLAADVPAPIRQAVLLLAAHWYGHRDASGPCEATTGILAPGILPLPIPINHLLTPYRRPHL